MMLKAVLDWQISVGHPIKVYCQVCFWGSANITTNARYCPYGHGELADASLFDSSSVVEKTEENCGEVEKFEETPEKVKTQSSFTPEEEPQRIDPTGTLVEQVCFGCGYKAVLPYRACCPTCRNPFPVSMLLCVTWPVLLQMAAGNTQVDTTHQPGELQLSLFGGGRADALV